MNDRSVRNNTLELFGYFMNDYMGRWFIKKVKIIINDWIII